MLDNKMFYHMIVFLKEFHHDKKNCNECSNQSSFCWCKLKNFTKHCSFLIDLTFDFLIGIWLSWNCVTCNTNYWNKMQNPLWHHCDSNFLEFTEIQWFSFYDDHSIEICEILSKSVWLPVHLSSCQLDHGF